MATSQKWNPEFNKQSLQSLDDDKYGTFAHLYTSYIYIAELLQSFCSSVLHTFIKTYGKYPFFHTVLVNLFCDSCCDSRCC